MRTQHICKTPEGRRGAMVYKFSISKVLPPPHIPLNNIIMPHNIIFMSLKNAYSITSIAFRVFIIIPLIIIIMLLNSIIMPHKIIIMPHNII
jgi:hypothetical protein